MKKIATIILSAAVVFSLTACGNKSLAPNIPDTQTSLPASDMDSSANTDSPSYAAIREPLVSICLPVESQYEYAEDGTLLFTAQSQYMELTVQEPEIANRIILDFSNRVDNFKKSAESICQQAIDSYSGANAQWYSYLSQQFYSPTRLDPGVLSLYGSSVSYAGGSRPIHSYTSANYSLITGEVLTLGSIISHADKIPVLCELIVENLSKVSAEKSLYENYSDIVTNAITSDDSIYEKWYFTNTGVCFYFSPYEIAPYSSGVITAEIPYGDLPGILSDDYFPPERLETSGELSWTLFDASSATQISQYIEAVLSETGSMLLISGNNPVQNIQILSQIDGKTVTLFYAYALYTDEAIVLKASEEMLNTMEILYDCDGQTKSVSLIPEEYSRS